MKSAFLYFHAQGGNLQAQTASKPNNIRTFAATSPRQETTSRTPRLCTRKDRLSTTRQDIRPQECRSKLVSLLFDRCVRTRHTTDVEHLLVKLGEGKLESFAPIICRQPRKQVVEPTKEDINQGYGK